MTLKLEPIQIVEAIIAKFFVFFLIGAIIFAIICLLKILYKAAFKK